MRDAPYDADILILSLERAEETCAAIASALAQRGISRRVIVVDQRSRPETIARLRASVGDNPDVVFICLGENLGVAGGRNRAAAAGRGRVLIGLDNDAEFDGPDCAARAVAALDAAPGLAAVGLRILRHADGGEDLSSWGYPLALLARAGESFDSVTFVGAGHAIRRAAWEDVGGYDPSLFFCWEEFDFCLRAIARGWRVRYRGDIAVRHKVSAEARQVWSGQRWFFFTRNRLYLARKFGASWPAVLGRFLAYVARGARNGLLRPTLLALPAAWRMAAEGPRVTLPPVARAYLRAHDAAHRGSWLGRLRREVLAALPLPEQEVKDQRVVQKVAPP